MSEPNAVMFVRNYLIERDEALAPGEADDDERMESAREIVEGVRKSLSTSVPADAAELVERLNAEVDEQRRMGEPIDGPLVADAASALLSLSAELETVKGERDSYKTGYEDASVDGMKQAARAEAAEAKLAGGEAVKVKPLEWADYDDPNLDGERQAWSNAEGADYSRYHISLGDDTWRLKRHPAARHAYEDVLGTFDTLKAAKAAAQADYESRILSALTHPAPTHNDGRGEVEPGMVPPVAGWVVLKKNGDGLFMSAADYDQISAAAEADIHDCGYFAVPLDTRPALTHEDGSGEKIDLSALNAWFPDGVPMVAIKIMFPERSMPLSIAEVRHVMAALAATHTSGEVTEAAQRLLKMREGIMSDVSSAHSNRGNGASEWMREDDRDFRKDLREAFAALEAALRGEAS